MSIERYVDFYCGRSKMDEKKINSQGLTITNMNLMGLQI